MFTKKQEQKLVLWEAVIIFLLLWLKRRDTTLSTILGPLELCRAHHKYSEQTSKKTPRFGSRVCQLQAKGILQTKRALDADQAAKQMQTRTCRDDKPCCSVSGGPSPPSQRPEPRFGRRAGLDRGLVLPPNGGSAPGPGPSGGAAAGTL